MFLNCLWGSRSRARIMPEPEDRGAAPVPATTLVFDRGETFWIPTEGSRASINLSIDQNISSRSRDQGIFHRIWGGRAESFQGVDRSVHFTLVRRFYGDEEEIALVLNDNRIVRPVE